MRKLAVIILALSALVVAPPAVAASKWADRDCAEVKKPKRQLACWRWQALNPDVPEPAKVTVEAQQGEPGAKGDKGDQGAAGARGPQGERGPTGPQGPAGPQGPQGEQGPAGAAGVDGTDGSGFPSGVIFLVNGACPSGTTIQGSQNRWTVYANDTTGRPWLTSGSSAQLFLSACMVN